MQVGCALFVNSCIYRSSTCLSLGGFFITAGKFLFHPESSMQALSSVHNRDPYGLSKAALSLSWLAVGREDVGLRWDL